MLRNFIFLFGVLCAGLMHNASAQLVFVPDTNLRAYLDSVMPGVVDANGYIDSNGPQALSMQSLTVNINWSPVVTTGLEALTNLEELHLLNDGPMVSLSITSLPGNLELLEIEEEFSVASLPQLPDSLFEMTLNGIHDLTSLPSLPVGLRRLYLTAVMDLSTVPSVPDTMHAVNIIACPALQTISGLPSVAQGVYLKNLPVTTLPALPVVVNSLIIDSLVSLLALNSAPERVGFSFDLYDLPLIDSIPLLPDSCWKLRFEGLSTSLVLGPLPSFMERLWLIDGGPTCLPMLPPMLEHFECWNCSATCLPNLPPALPDVHWDSDILSLSEAPMCNAVTPCPPVVCTIKGTAFLDGDGDGVQDAGESPYPGAVITTLPPTWLAGTDQNGAYTIWTEVDTFALSCSVDLPWVQAILPTSNTALFTQLGQLDSLNDFGIALTPNIQDLVVDLTPSAPPIPGFNHILWLTYRNVGSRIQDGSVSFTYDPLLNFVSSWPVADLVSANTLTWDFAQLGIGEQRTIAITMNTPLWAFGASVEHNAWIEPIATDATPANNSFSLAATVVGSYDPNDKTVSPIGLTPAQVASEERLTYIIRFQNTGTWPATRVVLTDTLSNDLQWNTMQEIAASHAHTWYIADGVLHVVFDNIMLPDSNANEPESHGFFKFSMKPVSTLMLGDAVSNIANIYFDFNAPVITNAAVFTVDNNVGVAEAERKDLQLSPNPTSDVLTVLLDEPADHAAVQVVDVTGRAVLSTTLSGTRLLLDVQVLRPGSYTVRVGAGMVGRFVKR